MIARSIDGKEGGLQTLGGQYEGECHNVGKKYGKAFTLISIHSLRRAEFGKSLRVIYYESGIRIFYVNMLNIIKRRAYEYDTWQEKILLQCLWIIEYLLYLQYMVLV